MKDIQPESDLQSLEARKKVALVEEALQYSHKLFSGTQIIWPDQCQHSLSYFQSLHNLVTNHCSQLDHPICTSSPDFDTSALGSLAIKLYYIQEQLASLLEKIRSFRSLCHSKSVRTKRIREEICGLLEQLSFSKHDIFSCIQAFSDDAVQQAHACAFGSPGTPENITAFPDPAMRLHYKRTPLRPSSERDLNAVQHEPIFIKERHALRR